MSLFSHLHEKRKKLARIIPKETSQIKRPFRRGRKFKAYEVGAHCFLGRQLNGVFLFVFKMQNILTLMTSWRDILIGYEVNKNKPKISKVSKQVWSIVYFDQRTGAPHAVSWSKSIFYCLNNFLH